MKASDLIRTLAEGVGKYGDNEVMIKSEYTDFYSYVHGVYTDRHLNVNTGDDELLRNQTMTIILTK